MSPKPVILDVDPGDDDAVAIMLACGAPELDLLAVTTVAGNVALVSLMGGSIGLGNTTPAAEFNVYVDPEAAREVFESGLPITMSGLDVTHQADAGRAEREALRSLGRVGGVVAELLEFFAATYERSFGFKASPLHDPVAVAAVMEPSLLRTRPMRVDVECESELTRGETVCDFYGITGKRPNAEVGVRLDRDGFFDPLYRSLSRL